MPSDTIKITAEVLQSDRSSCRFTVDRPLLRDAVLRFRDEASARHSPLAARLFKISGVRSVLIQGADVTLSHQAPVDWRAVGPQVGAAIREHLASGEPAVRPEAFEHASSEDQLRNKVQKILDEQINPAVASHGGFITLVDVQGSDIYIQMGGGCQGCGQADVTLRDGVEEALRSQVPGLGQILDATDHAAGENPYFSSSQSH